MTNIKWVKQSTLRNIIANDSWNRQREKRGEDPARWETGSRSVAEAKEHEYRLRYAEVPDDTRSLTARFCGDPLPGRSARDRLVST